MLVVCSLYVVVVVIRFLCNARCVVCVCVACLRLLFVVCIVCWLFAVTVLIVCCLCVVANDDVAGVVFAVDVFGVVVGGGRGGGCGRVGVGARVRVIVLVNALRLGLVI